MSLYLDASVLLSIVNDEEPSKTVERFLAAAGTSLWVSEFASAEVVSAFSRLVRMGNLSSDRAQESLVAYDGWVAAEANERRTQAENGRAALFRLRVNLAIEVRSTAEVHMASPRWRARCQTGETSS